MIKVWTIQEVKNPDSEMLEQHVIDCKTLLWEYKKDAELFWLVQEDYEMIERLNEDIEYCKDFLKLGIIED